MKMLLVLGFAALFAAIEFASANSVTIVRIGKYNFQKMEFNVSRPSSNGLSIRSESEIIDRFTIYVEPTLKNQTDAQKLCRVLGTNTDLSIMNSAIFTAIQLSKFPPVGRYWINGKVPSNGGGRSNYDVESNCAAMKNAFDVSTGVRFKPGSSAETCLVLSKGNGLESTYLEELPCSNRHGVMCSFLNPPATC